MSLGIEVTQRLDLVIQEIDAHRLLGAHWINVDKGTTNRELAMFFDLRNPQVGGGTQCIDELLAIERLAGRKHQGAGRNIVDRR